MPRSKIRIKKEAQHHGQRDLIALNHNDIHMLIPEPRLYYLTQQKGVFQMCWLRILEVEITHGSQHNSKVLVSQRGRKGFIIREAGEKVELRWKQYIHFVRWEG
jgi:hypothetical protein